MKAYEFVTRVEQDKLTLPTEIAARLTPQMPLRVIVLVNDDGESDETSNWQHLAAEHFFHGYDPGDAIYDSLSGR